MSGAGEDRARAVRALLFLWLAGICLRITVLAIPPVIPQIHESFRLSQAAIGALTSLPVLLFSFAAIPGSLLVSRLGAERVLIAGVMVTAVAGALRGVSFDALALFAATFAMGVGIAIMQPALPVVVRTWAPERVALGTATYSNGLLVGEALSASLTIPWVLPMVGNSWRGSLVAWSVPVAVIGLALMARAMLREVPDRGPAAMRAATRWWPDWRDPLTWKLGLVAGYASSLYFGVNAFLPDYLQARGEASRLNASLSALNWLQMPASLLLLMFARRLTARGWPFVVLSTISLAAILGLLLTNGAWLVAWSGVIGFCNAFLLILTLALPPLIAKSEDVHRLSAAMLFIGYLCAFLFPLVGGFLWDLTGHPTAAFVPLAAFAAISIALSARLRFA